LQKGIAGRQQQQQQQRYGVSAVLIKATRCEYHSGEELGGEELGGVEPQGVLHSNLRGCSAAAGLLLGLSLAAMLAACYGMAGTLQMLL
jgi:hypothetical protein